jgi:hypothetical protein
MIYFIFFIFLIIIYLLKNIYKTYNHKTYNHNNIKKTILKTILKINKNFTKPDTIIKEYSIKIINDIIHKNRYVYIINVNEKLDDIQYKLIFKNIFYDLQLNKQFINYFLEKNYNIEQIFLGQDIDNNIIKFYVLFNKHPNNYKIKCIEFDYIKKNYFFKNYVYLSKNKLYSELKKLNPKFIKIINNQKYYDGYLVYKKNEKNINVSLYKSNKNYYLTDFENERKGLICDSLWHKMLKEYFNEKIYWINITQKSLTFYFRK